MTITSISISVAIIMSLILVTWLWNRLGNIDNPTKIISIILGIIIVWIFTLITFNIAKIGINFENKDVLKTVRRVFVIMFTIINGYLVLPFLFKRLNLINNNEIDKEKFKKSIIILLIIVVIVFIFEINYMGSLQKTIIELMNK